MASRTFDMLHAKICAVLLALVTGASAQVTFTVTGTISTDGNGFTSGDAVSFTFTLVQNPPQAFTGYVVASNLYTWEDTHLTNDTPLWANVTGSINGNALGGTWIRPASDVAAPFSNVYAGGPSNPTLGLAASSDSGESIGLTHGANFLSAIEIQSYYTGLSFNHSSGTLPAANAYFPAYAGVYNVSTPSTTFFELNNSTTINFTPATLTIAAVPEPSTYAVLLGLAAIGLAWRRRQSA